MRTAPPDDGRLPDFLVVGAMKAGTTSLYHYLRQHPEVFLPAEKEPHYFVDGPARARGLGWYRSLFAGAGADAVVGEASTGYAMFPHYAGVPERVIELLPDVKLVYVVREPIDRMRSHWLHAYARGVEARPLAEALLSQAIYADTSRYALQLEQWLVHVPRHRVLLLRAEDLRRDRRRTLARVHEFLGVDPARAPADVDREHHVSADKQRPRPWARAVGGFLIRRGIERSLSPAAQARLERVTTVPIAPEQTVVPPDVRARLTEVLRPEMERFRRYAGPEFDEWEEAS